MPQSYISTSRDLFVVPVINVYIVFLDVLSPIILLSKIKSSILTRIFLTIMTILLICMNYFFFSLDYILNALEKLKFSHTFFRNYLFLWITVNKILLEFWLLYVWSMHVSFLWIVYILSLFHNGYWILLIIQMNYYYIVFINFIILNENIFLITF